MTIIASDALAGAISTPSRALATIVTVDHPCIRPTVIEARTPAAATTPIVR